MWPHQPHDTAQSTKSDSGYPAIYNRGRKLIVPDYNYHRPTTLQAACQLMEELPRAQFLAGGTDLLNDLDSGMKQAGNLITLQALPELKRIADHTDHVSIGPCCSISDLERSPVIRDNFPELISAGKVFATPQVKNRATLGGNICSAVACGDFPVILTVLNAELQLFSTQGTRTIPIKDFALANRKTRRGQEELLMEIKVPKKPASALAHYEKFRRRAASSLAVASVAVYLDFSGSECTDARIVLGAVAPSPVNAVAAAEVLTHKKISHKLILTAADIARSAARPINDVRATADYRRELVFVLTKRSLLHLLDMRKEIR